MVPGLHELPLLECAYVLGGKIKPLRMLALFLETFVPVMLDPRRVVDG